MVSFAFQYFEHPGAFELIVAVVLSIFLFVALDLVPFTGLLYGIYYLLTLPMRRNERARFFLDLLELGLREGRTPEAAITDVAASHDSALGVRFQMVAIEVQRGRRLGEALKRVPRFLPPEVSAMLATGERIGDVGRVLPACRVLLRDSVSQVRGALNYLLILGFIATPLTIAVPVFLKIKVLPAFKAIFEGMFEDATRLPPFTQFILSDEHWLIVIPAVMFGLVWLAILAYLGGPRLQRWLQRLMPGVPDWLLCRLPWRRKRLQRDFSAMLAVLLEAHVPEAEAVRLAGEGTANAVMRGSAERVCARLSEGVKLPEAVRLMDDSGELQWRLANALRQAGGFVRALTGWHEALDAKAFQLEQTAAHCATTLFVLVNGFMVACIVIGIFMALVRLLNEAILW